MSDQPTKVKRWWVDDTEIFTHDYSKQVKLQLSEVVLATDYDDLRKRVATVLREADARYDETFAHGFLAGWNAAQQQNEEMLKVQQITLAEAAKLVTQRTKQVDELLKEIDP